MSHEEEIYDDDPNAWSVEKCKERLNQILNDPQHAYLDVKGTASLNQREAAVKFVDKLHDRIYGKTETISGYVEELSNERLANIKENHDNMDFSDDDRKSSFGHRDPEDYDPTHHDIGLEATKDVSSGYRDKIEDVE